MNTFNTVDASVQTADSTLLVASAGTGLPPPIPRTTPSMVSPGNVYAAQ